MDKNLIYALCDPDTNEIRYVGKSTTGMRRPRDHMSPYRLKHAGYKTNWIKSLMERGLKPIIRVLEVLETPEKLTEAEIRWIAQCRADGCRLTNLTDGGDGTLGWRQPEHVKQRLRDLHLGQTMPDDVKKKISDANKGQKKSAITRTRMSESLKIRPHTEESRVKTSRTLGGKPFVDDQGRRWETCRGAARALGLQESNIRSVLKGRLRQTGGRTFRYV